MASFQCSHCGASITHNPAFAGKRAKCPKCQQPILVPKLTDPPSQALTPTSYHPPAMPPPISPAHAPAPQPTVVVVGNQEPRLQSGGWFARAFTTMSGIIVAVLLFLLVAVGLPVMVVCGGCLYMAGQVGESIEEASKKIEAERAANSPKPFVEAPGGANGDVAPTAAASPDTAEPTPADLWHPHDQPLTVGDVVVRVERVTRGKVPLVDFRGKGLSKDDLLIIRLSIENTSPNKKVDLTRWNGQSAILGPFASLDDDAGNQYKRITFSFGTKVDDLEERTSIYPGKSEPATLVFELPVDAAKELRLSLPAKAVGGQGDFRFAIPTGIMASEQ